MSAYLSSRCLTISLKQPGLSALTNRGSFLSLFTFLHHPEAPFELQQLFFNYVQRAAGVLRSSRTGVLNEVAGE